MLNYSILKIYTIFIILSTYTCNNIFKYSYESPYKAPILPLMLLPSVHQQLSLFTVLQFPSLTTFITHYSNLKNTCWVILAIKFTNLGQIDGKLGKGLIQCIATETGAYSGSFVIVSR